MADRPDVVIVVIDCLRSDRIADGGRACRTPNIDRLAARGTVLPNVFVENSITTPSFASLLTGRYSGNHGLISMVGSRLDEGIPTMAEIFAANGYATCAETTGPLHPLTGIGRGFAEYRFRSQQDHAFTGWGDDLLRRVGTGQLARPFFLLVHLWEAHRPIQVPAEFNTPEYGEWPYDRAISAIDAFLGRLFEALDPRALVVVTGDHGECLGERPPDDGLLAHFLRKLDLALPDPQTPGSIDDATALMAEEPRLHRFAAEIAEATEEGVRCLPRRTRLRMTADLLRIGFTRYRIQSRKGVLFNLSTTRQKATDNLLLLAVLRGDRKTAQRHLVRNALNEHVLQHGYHIYDYLQRVPVVLAGDGSGPAGRRVETELRHIDLLPTLVEMLNLRAPAAGFDGASYAAEIRNGGGPDRPVYLEARGGARSDRLFLIRGFRRNRMKVAYAPFERSAPVEFYELGDDPAERLNRAGNAGCPVEALRKDAEKAAAAFHSAARKLSAAETAEVAERLRSLGYM
jgi:arylsulfatase A-like enzyme